MHINKISNKFFSLDCYSSVYLNLNLCDTSIMFTLYSKHAYKCKNATHMHILYGCRWIKIRHYTIVARSFGRYINALCRRTPKLLWFIVNTYIYIFLIRFKYFSKWICAVAHLVGWLVKYVSWVSKLLIVMVVYLWINGRHTAKESGWWSIKWKRCREFSDSI